MFIDNLKDDLKRHEGLKLKPYRCTAGKLTIGYGRNLDDVGITELEAEHLLETDITTVFSIMDASWTWWRDMPEGPQRALANMCFNLGFTRLSKFKNMLASLEAGNYGEAAEHALDSNWAKQVGNRAVEVVGMIRSGAEQ